jgi:curli biogenesis system outer membrane secretion channel CsgG
MLGCAVALCACSSPEIEITYTRPPSSEVPDYVKKVGVIPFKEGKSVSEKGIGNRVQKKIESALVKSRFFKIVTRSQLENMLKEQKLSFASFAEGGGKDLQIQIVDAMIIGSVNRAQSAEKRGSFRALVPITRGALSRIFGAMGKERYTFKDFKRGRYIIAEVAMSFELIDYKGGGVVLASHEYTRSYDSRTEERFRGKRYGTAPEELPVSHVRKLEDLIEVGAKEFLAMIAPSTIKQSVTLLDPTYHTQQGVKFAKRSLVDEAVEQFNLAIQNDDPETKHAAFYDLGVMLEIQGKYQDAFDAFKQAYTLYDAELYLDAMERMKKEMAISEE